MKIIGYIRVSTNEQVKSGLGLEAQKSAIENYANKYPDIELLIFKDEGLSGSLSLDKRPELMNAINSLKKGDRFIVTKRDRLGRDAIEVGLIEKQILKKSELISLAGEGTDNNDPSSILMRRVHDAISEYERLIIGARTKAALAVKKKKKERVGYIPFGFKISSNNKNLEPHHDEQQILKAMESLKVEKLSVRKIADKLNEQNLLNRNDSKWNHMSVHRVMKGIKNHTCLY